MAYTINLTNGNVLTTIPDGTVNTSACSQTLIGKNYAGYGQFLDDNFVHLLENAANSTPPGAPLTGQLWFNTATGVINVYNGVGFKPLGGANASGSAPTNNSVGDLWYDTTNAQLNVWTGTQWLLVGPIYNSATGKTGAIPAIIADTIGNSHIVTELYVNNNLVGLISDDVGGWSPSPAISGFANVYPGIQLSTLVNNVTPQFNGTATNALQLNGVTGNAFMVSTGNTSTSGTLSVVNNTGLFVGTTGQFNIDVVGNAVNLSSTQPNGNINFVISQGGTPTTAISINGQNGNVTIPNLVVAGSNGVISTNSILNSGSAGTGNIGNSAVPFNTVFATATRADYADVAERFAADADYAPGTVVELGGTAEITRANTELSELVFGVISTNAAYLMNNGAGSNATHPPVAMTGRVPVQVIGIVQKGDRLVSAGNGMARSAQPGEATAFNVIGRALVSKLDAGVGTVEAIVTIK